MIAKSHVALVALLALTSGACSDGNRSSTATVPASGRDTLATTPPTSSRPVATSTTAPTVPRVNTTTVAVAEVPTTQVGSTIATSPTANPVTTVGSPAPEQTTATASISAPAPVGAVALIDKDCAAANPGSGYDLLHVKVEPLSTRYRLTARYSGDTFQHDILISFDLGDSSYLVTAELFEDGKGVGRIAGRGSSEAVFLDPPQTIAPGLVDLMVRNDQIGGVSGTAFDVVVFLKVDGSAIESCQR